ncbi:orotidine 5'-phosphate decarboxylase [bacterium]|nr:orotidine 5'-phosphate decarboxylase [bacterium]
MGKNLFEQPYGVIPACDVHTLDEFKRIIDETCSIEGIAGYKVGCTLALTYGLSALTKIVADYTDLPVIYDHQKAGTDIPQMGAMFAEVCAKGGVKGVIIFPQSGPMTEEAFIKALYAKDLVPIVGGEMTHPKYLVKEEGFIRDDAPMEMYRIGAKNCVDHFVIPGNKPDIIRKYHSMLSSLVKQPKYCLPGIGRQGGEIKSAFIFLKGASAYAIVGSGIYKQKNMAEAARGFCKEALEFE